MFYDLENPIDFVREISRILAPDGIWHFEQSYMPSMLRMNAYDTICHEHLEYYCLHNIWNILQQAGLKILDVQMNSVNGGSFAVTASLKKSKLKSNDLFIDWLLRQEESMGLKTIEPYMKFKAEVKKHQISLRTLIETLREDGKRISGYGASTKGNVILQYCALGKEHIDCIGEINPDKFGHFTPGTHIPIIPESEALAQKPDYLLVLPWHFRDGIMQKEEKYLEAGGKMIFPLPEIEIVGG